MPTSPLMKKNPHMTNTRALNATSHANPLQQYSFQNTMMVCTVMILSFITALPVRADQLEHIGSFDWPTVSIVGLSGLEVSEDGTGFRAIGDRGWYISGQFERASEQIIDITIEKHLPILGNNGLPVSSRRVGDWSDAEGLAVAPDGTLWISFERWTRVARYDAPELAGQWVKDHPDFATWRDNRQLEALAIDSDGVLFTFPERPLPEGYPIYRLDQNTWSIGGHLPEDNGFSIVGADFGTDGLLYLLERKLVLGLWWQNQIRRLDITVPNTIEVLWTGQRGEYFNLEGISLWQDGTGQRITLVSDDNADPDETTQFVEFRIIPE